ncbi:rna polymerase II, related [Neospora caninum Liverpool]|uniref:RNA polymerase II, related n=1 Tax=Neospora caninum (strain Liverpool) TaxID=572307 RepID=F0VAU6_NEOCL|nr:rna polymerase II, related [Neospora caninum Liverpool]CBZ50804.1 rna polymerase II, related [Neospora caninum Liverpool]CEL68105.1 TPA: RNA polymerase II, related [Neospora caninum Liverpool]|eukprot:XP_003880837.1 rna polymerase II, related [Neospora caninum Liverpool]
MSPPGYQGRPSASIPLNSNRLVCAAEGPRHTSSGGYAGAFLSSSYVDDVFSIDKFCERTFIKFLSVSPERVVFELKGVDAAIPNALRRILISEVPTIAIETVQIWQNTGVVQDEVLAHRLGLIPFVVDPTALNYRQPNQEFTDENALRVSLHVKCTEQSLGPHQTSLPVYARDIKWEPMSPSQKEAFAANPPRAVHPDILITKLRPGQEIELKAYLEKGVGKTHAKWSPVCTAVYRLEPEIVFKEPIQGEEASDLCSLCPMGVFDVEDTTGEAYARYPRNCTTCRACIERFPNGIELRKIKDHFIFSIESTGSVPAPLLFKMAIEILKEKALTFRQIIDVKLASGI